MKNLLTVMLLFSSSVCFSQRTATVVLHPEKAETQISKHIYGHFSEHLGSCIYGGLWVGPNSEIPNINGYRKDVFEALKALNIPNMRWPGGCFADEYHWMDGIGPQSQRPKMVNNNWGGTVEDNSFGTHEFLNLCEMLGCEPYISGNVGSGSVEEMAKWVEYMTSDGDSPMANLRRKNGRDKAWNVKFIGVGNESWGCGGNMRPEYYSDLYRRYSTYCRNYDNNRLFKIASGASDYDFNWTEVLMQNIGNRMDGISLHYYTCKGWSGSKGSATNFNKDDYYWAIQKALGIEPVILRHISIMDKYDSQNRIALLVDEWGTWWDTEPGTNPGHLFQQNTMRDAMVAAITLNVFNKYGERIKMANIAQVVNVLQSMILTKDDKMVLTPSYFVFDMYKNHMDNKFIPSELICDSIQVTERDKVPMVSVSASKNEAGAIFITLANINADDSEEVVLDIPGNKFKNFESKILKGESVNSYNSFEKPNSVNESVFKDVKIKGEKVTVKMPAHSIVSLMLK